MQVNNYETVELLVGVLGKNTGMDSSSGVFSSRTRALEHTIGRCIEKIVLAQKMDVLIPIRNLFLF